MAALPGTDALNRRIEIFFFEPTRHTLTDTVTRIASIAGVS